MKNPAPETRDKIYSLVAAIVTILTVLGLIRDGDFDVERITQTVVGLVVIYQAVLAKVNVSK